MDHAAADEVPRRGVLRVADKPPARADPHVRDARVAVDSHAGRADEARDVLVAVEGVTAVADPGAVLLSYRQQAGAAFAGVELVEGAGEAGGHAAVSVLALTAAIR